MLYLQCGYLPRRLVSTLLAMRPTFVTAQLFEAETADLRRIVRLNNVDTLSTALNRMVAQGNVELLPVVLHHDGRFRAPN